MARLALLAAALGTGCGGVASPPRVPAPVRWAGAAAPMPEGLSCASWCVFDGAGGGGCSADAPIGVIAADGQGLTGAVDPRGFDRLRVRLDVCDADGWVFHLGDSPGNDGHGGDDGTTASDAELQIVAGDLTMFGNDSVGARGLHEVKGVAPTSGCGQVELVVADGRVSYRGGELRHGALLRVGGDEPYWYFGVNRTVASEARRGRGVQRTVLCLERSADSAVDAAAAQPAAPSPAAATSGSERAAADGTTTLADGVVELRASALRLRTRRGLAWTRVLAPAPCDDRAARAPAMRVTRRDSRSMELRLVEAAPTGAGDACAGWIPTAWLAAAAREGSRVEVLGHAVPMEHLGAFVDGAPEPVAEVAYLNGRYALTATGSDGPVSAELQAAIDDASGTAGRVQLRLWIVAPSTTRDDAEELEVVAGRGRARLRLVFGEGEGEGRVRELYTGELAPTDAIFAADRVELRRGRALRARLRANPFRAALDAARRFERQRASRDDDLGPDAGSAPRQPR